MIRVVLIFTLISFCFPSKASTYFDVTITGEGAPIIFIPGLGCDGDVWQHTVEHMAAKYECHVFTLAGFAGTTPFDISKGFLPRIQNALVTYISDSLNQKPILIGHSLGGYLSLAISSANPDLIAKVVVVDSYPSMAKSQDVKIQEKEMYERADWMKSQLLAMTDSAFLAQQKYGVTTLVNSMDDQAKILAWSIASDRETFVQAMYEIMVGDLTKAIRHIKVPVLVLGSWYGGKDYGITKAQVKVTYEEQLKRIKDCKVLIADKARHFIMLDEPEWFLSSVQNFLAHEK